MKTYMLNVKNAVYIRKGVSSMASFMSIDEQLQ